MRHAFLLALAALSSFCLDALAAQTTPISLPLSRKIQKPIERVSDSDRQRKRALKAQRERQWPPEIAAKRISPRSGPSDSVQVTNAVVTYTAHVDVGDPPQTYELLIDTGSSNTWVGNSKLYRATLETRPDGVIPGPVVLVYGSGLFTGVEMVEQLSLTQQLRIRNQSIAVSEPPLPQGFSNMDGILGIGPVDLTRGTMILENDQHEIPTVVDNLFSSGVIPAPVVGIYYEPATIESSVNGELTLGGVDDTKYLDQVHYTPITTSTPASSYWGIDQTIVYGTETILAQTSGIVDTGTTLILLATDAFSAYKSATGATYDNSTGLLKISTEDFHRLKNLDFHIGGQTFSLTPDAQIWPRLLNSDIGGDSQSIYLIVGDLGTNSGSGLDFINGYGFLERFYSVYDTGNRRVGLAETQYTNAKLSANATLDWVSCYSGLQCALLQVPLDYTFGDSRNASIAITRIPATATDSYLGPVLFNPGGPGGSGVAAILSAGASFAEFLGPQFDIVGFDPRGVGFSQPSASFFASAAQRAFWLPEDLNLRYPALDANSEVLSNQWAQYQLVGQQARRHDTTSVLQYFTTDNVAEDMLRITEAFGFEKLQYWGVSYGTVLGQTFATLFPDKVGRMVIDGKVYIRLAFESESLEGVMDGEAWFSANITESLTDSDKALQDFFDGCFDAGPTGCAYYDSSPNKIANNLQSLFQTYHQQPRPVLTNESHGVVDYSFLRNIVFGATFSPYGGFAPLAERLAELTGGNATNTYAQYQVDEFKCDSSANTNVGSIFEAEIATTCGDANSLSYRVLLIYGHLGESGAQAGKFTVRRVSKARPLGANTSFPLLVIGNTVDPITPLVWAAKAVKLFPGSVLITQNSPGHTSLVAPSNCTHGALAAYFQDGTLPAVGKVCEVDAELFPKANVKTGKEVRRGLENTIRSIANGVRIANKGGRLAFSLMSRHVFRQLQLLIPGAALTFYLDTFAHLKETLEDTHSWARSATIASLGLLGAVIAMFSYIIIASWTQIHGVQPDFRSWRASGVLSRVIPVLTFSIVSGWLGFTITFGQTTMGYVRGAIAASALFATTFGCLGLIPARRIRDQRPD
ncbi:AB hydrolase-1 domain-containing protein [Mycena indigotica]|uniref:AB hydrolase-1 domain-containing protein n=1 Tax=Mycena indigotica TaxID=2126181 RepID=A0A8H6WB56_9AGAR|nr:AB hydrolase-1 domain-containing protein [Mycena indigotica]KAF7312284.1 AB hydrolase-1 domain-containing protein [Mycena indigotica]